jgi:hypothetical protein
MPSAPDTSSPSDAIAASKATRERVRSLPVADPARGAALLGALGSLKDCWTAEHETYMRRGPQNGRLLSRDPVRVVGRERAAEMRRVRSMLRPTPGTPRPAAQAPNAQTMNGHVGQARQRLLALAGEHDTVRRLHGNGERRSRKGGGFYTSMQTLNEEARRLLDEVTAVRRKLTIANGRFMRQPVDGYADGDARDQVATAVQITRNEATLLATELRRSATRKTPLSSAERRAVGAGTGRQTWSADRVVNTLRAFYLANGRWPTAGELRGDPQLPHYTTLQRLYGPRFLARLDTLVAAATS